LASRCGVTSAASAGHAATTTVLNSTDRKEPRCFLLMELLPTLLLIYSVFPLL
jgi:hypothetical protein